MNLKAVSHMKILKTSSHRITLKHKILFDERQSIYRTMNLKNARIHPNLMNLKIISHAMNLNTSSHRISLKHKFPCGVVEDT